MTSGLITKNPTLCINSTRNNSNSSPNFLSFSDNTYHPISPPPLLQSPKTARFRIIAAISDEAETLSDMSFNDLLGIPESGRFSEIKQAYKQLARKYHPDVSPPDTPHHIISPRNNSNSIPNFLSFSDNTYHPISPPPLLQSPKTPRFRTKATSNDESEILSDMSFYELLGIPESGSFSEIKQAYKQLARKYHPDVSPPDRAEEYTKRFIAVQEAYATLSDPSTRALYDRDMARGLHLTFSSRKEGLMERNEWRNQWQAQLSGLEERSMKKKKTSWAAQMRQKRLESEGTD